MTTIILNKEAVDTLFPEGTEARVQLQQSVLEQLVKQSIKAPNIASEVQVEITRAQENLRASCLMQLGVAPTRCGGIKLSQNMMDEIKREVSYALGAGIRESVELQASKDRINEIVEYQIASHLSVTVRKALEEAMKANTVLQSLAAIASGKTA